MRRSALPARLLLFVALVAAAVSGCAPARPGAPGPADEAKAVYQTFLDAQARNEPAKAFSLSGSLSFARGGKSGRLSFATSISGADGRWNTLLGVQAEKSDPVWGWQRDLTRQFNQNGYNGAAPVASRDWMIFDELAGQYVFMDSANCANVSGGFGGTVDKQTRPGSGDYCGSLYTPGYRTLKNEKEGAQLYAHSTFELNENAQAYADILLNQEKVKYHVGSGYTWWGTSVKWGAFYDPNLHTLLNLQRAFAPEDMGNWKDSMSENKSSSYSVSLGVNGTRAKTPTGTTTSA